MLTNVLLDTNIVMDLFDATRIFHLSSLKIVRELLENGTVLYVNSDTLTTSFYLLRSRKKMTQEESLKALRDIVNICELIPIEIEDVSMALDLCEDDRSQYSDYEDAVQYVCAKKINADAIITNDKNFISEDIKLIRIGKKESKGEL